MLFLCSVTCRSVGINIKDILSRTGITRLIDAFQFCGFYEFLEFQ